MASTDRGLVTLPPTATAADIKEVTDRDGGVIVAGVLDVELLARINAELDVHLTDRDPSDGYEDDPDLARFYGLRTKRLQSLAARSDAVVEALLDPRLLAWAEGCLTWCSEIQMNTAQLIEIGPGEPAQPLHRDETLWPELAAVTDEELMVSCMLALSDFTEETGATRVVPGTHRSPKRPPESYSIDESVPAVMTAGSALFFTGSVVHGGGANVSSDRSRRGLTMTYALGWMRAEEAHNLSMPIERAAALPPRMRELLSFASYRTGGGGMSYQLDMGDPYVRLFGQPRPTTVTVAPRWFDRPTTTRAAEQHATTQFGEHSL